MRIAIPLADGRLCPHFGHCEQFAIIDVDDATKQIQTTTLKTPPPHEPGVLPRWLHDEGVQTILAGGMGQRAQQLFTANGVTVVVGVPAEAPEMLIRAFLDGALKVGANACDH